MLLLRAPRSLPSGEVELEVRVEVASAIPFPVTLKATLPRGATLTDGKLEEPLDALQPGLLQRTFRLRTTEAIDASNPFRMTLHGESQDRSAGVHTEQATPAPVKAPAPFVPPAVRRPPASVRR